MQEGEEVIEETAYQAALSLPLDRKIEKGVALFREYESAAKTFDMFEPWYHLCTSGGKDSIVLDWLAQEAGIAFKRYNSITTIDPPELIRFLRKTYPDVISLRPEKALLTRLWQDEGQGPPTRIARWCCEIYKENGCHGQIKCFGVRADESGNRKANWRTWTPLKADHSWVLAPLLYWTDADIWKVIRTMNLPYCSLYDEGFKRLGCIGCPMAGKLGRQREFKRWPTYERAWKRSFDKFWRTWHGVPLQRERWVSMEGKYAFQALPSERLEKKFVMERNRIEEGFYTLRRWYDLKGYKTWEELWDWWMEDEEEPEGCTMGLH